jgi:hypothetical protein
VRAMLRSINVRGPKMQKSSAELYFMIRISSIQKLSNNDVLDPSSLAVRAASFSANAPVGSRLLELYSGGQVIGWIACIPDLVDVAAGTFPDLHLVHMLQDNCGG